MFIHDNEVRDGFMVDKTSASSPTSTSWRQAANKDSNREDTEALDQGEFPNPLKWPGEKPTGGLATPDMSEYGNEEEHEEEEDSLESVLAQGDANKDTSAKNTTLPGATNTDEPLGMTILCDLEALSNASFKRAFTYCTTKECLARGITDTRETFKWIDGLPDSSVVKFIESESCVPERRVFAVTALCNTVSAKAYQDYMTTQQLTDQIFQLLGRQLKHEIAFRLGKKPETPFKKQDKARGLTLLEATMTQTWEKKYPSEDLRLKPSSMDVASTSSSRRREEDGKQPVASKGGQASSVTRRNGREPTTNTTLDSKTAEQSVQKAIGDKKTNDNLCNPTRKVDAEASTHFEYTGFNTELGQDLMEALSQTCQDVKQLKAALLRQHGTSMKSLKNQIDDMQEVVSKTILEQKEVQAQTLAEFKALFDTQTQSINVLSGLVRLMLPKHLGEPKPHDFVMEVQQELDRRVKAKMQTPMTRKRAQFMKMFDIQDTDVARGDTIEFPCKQKEDIISVLTTPRLKKAFLSPFDFAGCTHTKAIHTFMARLVGFNTKLSKCMYLRP